MGTIAIASDCCLTIMIMRLIARYVFQEKFCIYSKFKSNFHISNNKSINSHVIVYVLHKPTKSLQLSLLIKNSLVQYSVQFFYQVYDKLHRNIVLQLINCIIELPYIGKLSPLNKFRRGHCCMKFKYTKYISIEI